MLNARLLTLVALVVGCASSVATPSVAQTETPLVCRVAADRAAFGDQHVVLEGRILTDFHHGSGLAHDLCPDAYLPIGVSQPNEVGGQEFWEAWYASRSCPDDPLYVTITGVMRQQDNGGRKYWALSASEFRDIRHANGSTCPMTVRELNERVEQYRREHPSN